MRSTSPPVCAPRPYLIRPPHSPHASETLHILPPTLRKPSPAHTTKKQQTTTEQDDLGGTGVIDALCDALRDKNEKVRRRAMATLGELLFYVATQQQDAALADPPVDVATAWSIVPGTLTAVTRLLKPSEDEIAQHYAVKTIENISSQGGDWAVRFATQARARPPADLPPARPPTLARQPAARCPPLCIAC